MNNLREIVRHSIYSVLLKEGIGLFEGCEELAKEVVKTAREECDDSEQGDRIKTVGIFCPWAPDNYLRVTTHKKITKGINATYLASYFVRYGVLVIGINPNYLKNSDDIVIPTIAHELTHAYEDVMTKAHGGVGINQKIQNTGYNKSLEYNVEHNDDDDDELSDKRDDVSHFMLRATSFERNARMASMVSSIMNTKRPISTTQEAYKFLSQTKTGRDFAFLKGFTESIMEEKDPQEQNEWMQIFFELTNYHFNTYNQLKKFVYSIYSKFQTKYNEIQAKAIHRYFYTKNPPQVNNVHYRINGWNYE